MVFGTVLFGRMAGSEDSGRVMGLFINTLPLRISIGDEPVEASVQKTHALLAELMRHEHASLALAQRCSAVPGAKRAAVLCPAQLPAPDPGGRTAAAPGTRLLALQEGISWLRGQERTNYPVTLSVDDLGEGFGLSAQTVASIAPMRDCQFMHTALESLAEALQNTPAAPLHTLQVLPTAERHQLLYGWNDTRTEFPADKCVHELFQEQVLRTPDATAVVFEDGQLSYAELNARANRLAHYLRGLGIQPDDRIALCLERGFDMIVALLAALKAGAAYVPLDPAYPVDRIRFMLHDAEPRALITQQNLHTLFRDLDTTRFPILLLGPNTAAWHSMPDSNPDPAEIGLTPQHLAYIIYTSGSTGIPKGVMVQHRGVVNRLWHAAQLPIRSARCGAAKNTVWFRCVGVGVLLAIALWSQTCCRATGRT